MFGAVVAVAVIVFVALCASLLQPRNAFLNFPVLDTLFYYGLLLP